jgi:putative tryptophan/tyrosine transport system substrate-binding protein
MMPFPQRGEDMRRREFLGLVGGAVATRPRVARAQQADRMRVVGVLMSPREDSITRARLTAFRNALQELGWTEGRNVRFDVRWADGDIDRVRTFANELVKLAPDVILARRTTVIARLKQTTRSIPLVFVIVNDPVAQGFVSSVAHPGGNITGFSFMDFSTLSKTLQLLKQVVPSLNRVGLMFNPDTYPYYEVYLDSLRGQRQEVALDVTALRVRSEAEIKQAFEGLAGAPGAGLIVPPEPFTSARRKLIVELATQYRLPAAYGLRDFVIDGGMMSYGPNNTDIFVRSASYIDRILKGANPGELPVQAPTRFEFVINQKTAQALGITIPANLLALADEVIE